MPTFQVELIRHIKQWTLPVQYEAQTKEQVLEMAQNSGQLHFSKGHPVWIEGDKSLVSIMITDPEGNEHRFPMLTREEE